MDNIFGNFQETHIRAIEALQTENKLLSNYQNMVAARFPHIPSSTPIASASSSSGTSCPLCLGIFPSLDDSKLGAQVAQSLLEEDAGHARQFEDYQLILETPLSLELRTQAYWIHIRTVLKSLHLLQEDATSGLFSSPRYFGEVADAPFLLRFALQESLTKIWGKPCMSKTGRLSVTVSFSHLETSGEEQTLVQSIKGGSNNSNNNGGSSSKRKMNEKLASTSSNTQEARDVMMKILKTANESQFIKNFRCPPPQITAPFVLKVKAMHEPLLLAGRYIKLDRALSQTVLMIDRKVRLGDSSVGELISEHILSFFKAKDTKLISAGREDMDVRMLGDGRPFVMEIADPQLFTVSGGADAAIVAALQTQINTADASIDRVQVKDLRIVTPDVLERLKEGEESKKKTYRCVVWTQRALSESDLQPLREIRDLDIQQKTPVRVLHRRSLATRVRTIHEIKCEMINPHFFIVDLVTQAGTYVKEFIHGDLGRTTPNFGSLLKCEADIIQLDVLSIDMEF